MSPTVSPQSNSWGLWYRQPAERWLDSSPIGNGRLGAMVFGGIEHELLMLNQSTVWSGSRNTTNVNPSAREYLGQMRQLFFEGKYAEGMPCAPSICAAERIPLGRICRWRSYASIRVTRVKVMQRVP